MSAHQIGSMIRDHQQFHTICAPASGGTFDLAGKSLATGCVTAAGTYYLPDSSPAGTIVVVVNDSSGIANIGVQNGDLIPLSSKNSGLFIRGTSTAASTAWTGAAFTPFATAETRATYAIQMTDCKVHDAMITNLPGTAANDDMGLVTGTPGTNALTLKGVDFGGVSTDEKCAFEFILPTEYVAGGGIVVSAKAGMLTGISDGTATLDCEAWLDLGDGTVSADICATAAQDINSLTLATKEFTITATDCVPGSRLFIRLGFGGSDTGNLVVMVPTITEIKVLLDVR